MDIEDRRIIEAVKRTEILRAPKQRLSTFGSTSIYYYLVTEPSYASLENYVTETVVREGRVIAERPRIVTPFYLSRLEGFSTEARAYFNALLKEHGADAPGVFYTYKNEPKELNIISDTLSAVVDRLNTEIDRHGDPLRSIIKGEDQFWDVSLMKFIYEITRSSINDNLWQMGTRGLLNIDGKGIPLDARVRIDELFRKVAAGDAEPNELKAELDRWDVFEEYQDQFLKLFKKK